MIIKERILKIVDYDLYAKTARETSYIDQADNDWLRELGDDYIWCVTAETRNNHIVIIWAQHRFDEGGHACLEAASELLHDGDMEIVGR